MQTERQGVGYFVDVMYGGALDQTGRTEGKVQQQTRKSVSNCVSTKIWSESSLQNLTHEQLLLSGNNEL